VKKRGVAAAWREQVKSHETALRRNDSIGRTSNASKGNRSMIAALPPDRESAEGARPLFFHLDEFNASGERFRDIFYQIR